MSGGNSFGPRTLERTGRQFDILADIPIWKTGGANIDWSTITAVSVDTVLPFEGITVKAGDKYIPYGTPMDRITVNAEVQTIDLSPGTDPTGGTFVVNYTDPTNGLVYSTDAIAYNASAATVQAAVDALEPIAAGDVVVTKSGFVYTFTFSGSIGNVPALTVTNSLTGADTAPAVATGTGGNASGGLYAPADTTASDGRQVLARGETFILPWTILMSESGSDHAPLIEGGRVFQARLKHSLNTTNAPTLANILLAMPLLQLVSDPG